MARRQWLLSIFFVAVIVLKVAESAFRLENWPLSDVRMFSGRVPPTVTPFRVTLSGTRGGPWFAVTAFDLGLSEDGLMRRLPSDVRTLPQHCGTLGRQYNARRPPAQRLVGLRARVLRVPRPGVPSEPFDESVECPLSDPGPR